MKIKRAPLVFHNVLSAKTTCHVNDWYISATELRNAIIRNGLYTTGPIIYQVKEVDAGLEEVEYTFYMPVNAPVELGKNNKFGFMKELRLEDGFVFRHADLDDDIEDSNDLLRECAREFQVELQEPFYNIYLDVYGDGIIDIYAPIVKGNSDD